MVNKKLEKMLEEGKIKACPYCKTVYEIRTVKGEERFITCPEIDFEEIDTKYHRPHKRCEEYRILDPRRFKC
jgi:hypothetical protein